jgi:transcriptional regulator with XRE-family HTH domain
MPSEKQPAGSAELGRRLVELNRALVRLSEGENVHEIVDRTIDAALREANRQFAEAEVTETAWVGTWSYAELIAENLRNLRDDARWTQGQLANAMTRVGFDWKRITVAEVEGGTRRVSLEELCGLAALFAVPVLSMLLPATDESGWVEINDSIDVRPQILRELVLGRGGGVGEGGTRWRAPATILLNLASDDRRPATDLWRNRK